jgi:microcystin-dependent protein
MASPFIGEIRLFSSNYPPKGWAFCNGQLLAINTNQALFSLLGTMYGGNGQTNFALPDMRGRVPMGVSQQYPQGALGGEATHTLILAELPMHQHQSTGTSSTDRGTNVGAGDYFGAGSVNIYGSAPAQGKLFIQPETISFVGGSQPHENTMPYLTLNFCIALIGIFPSRS